MAAGKEIKRLREAGGKRISVAKVAGLIGVDPERLRKWEQRDADPTDIEDAHKIEKYFGVAIADLNSLDSFQFKKTNTLNVDVIATHGNTIYVIELKDQIKELKEDKAFIKKQYEERLQMLETNLNEIRSNQIGLIVMVKEAIQRAAVYKYGHRKKTLEQELEEINKIVGAVLK